MSRTCCVSTLLCVALLVANTSWAQSTMPSVDISAHFAIGGALTEDANLRAFDLSFPGKYDDSVSLDIGGSIWFPIIDLAKQPFGLDVGVMGAMGYYGAKTELGLDFGFGFFEFDDFELHLIPISILALLRVPCLPSEGRPRGLFQPYIGIGPMFATGILAESDGGIGFDVGYDLRLGVNLNVTDTFGVFFEYKRTEVDMKIHSNGFTNFSTNFDTNHVMVGVGMHL